MNCEAPLYQNCLLRLPRDVFLEGIVGYLRPRDLQQLDTAFTNRRQRPLLRKLWKSYRYSTPDDQEITFTDLQWLIDVNAIIFGINISSNNIFTDEALLQLARGCSQLEVLRISGGEFVSDAGIIALAQYCPKLHTVSLNKFPNITDDCILALCEHCPHVQHISLEECNLLTGAAPIAIAYTYPELQTIELVSSYMITERSCFSLAANCHELRKVMLSYNNDGNTSAALTALWTANPHLIDVNLSSRYIADADIVSLAQLCLKLQAVSLLNCCNISDASVIALAEHCPNLTALNVGCCRKITDSALIALAKHCANLTALNIGDCTNITDASLIALAEHSPKLTALDLNDCTNITDTSWIALGSHSHCLRSLHISGNTNLTVDGVTALTAGCPLLQEVSAFWSSFDSACVIALVSGCHDLRKLNLGGCNDIGLSAISAIARNCPLITWLDLAFTDVDDTCLLSIAEHCRFLTHLEIHNSEKEWSHDVLVLLAEACPLEYLHIYRVKQRTVDEMKRIRPCLMGVHFCY